MYIIYLFYYFFLHKYVPATYSVVVLVLTIVLVLLGGE